MNASSENVTLRHTDAIYKKLPQALLVYRIIIPNIGVVCLLCGIVIIIICVEFYQPQWRVDYSKGSGLCDILAIHMYEK